jgi:hypothetical protein
VVRDKILARPEIQARSQTHNSPLLRNAVASINRVGSESVRARSAASRATPPAQQPLADLLGPRSIYSQQITSIVVHSIILTYVDMLKQGSCSGDVGG